MLPSTGRDFPVQNPAFEASRQYVTQHHPRFFVGPGRDRMEAGVGVRNTDVFGLSDRRVHWPSTSFTG